MSILGKTTFTVERAAAGSRVNGRWVDGAASTLTLRGSWQPMSSREREQLPEGYRTKHVAKLYTDCDQPLLTCVDLATATRQDVILRDGRRYEVIAVADWSDHAAPTRHRAYTLAEIGADEETRR